MRLYRIIENQTGSNTKIETTKDCKSFAGVVNYLSMFCPNLQMLLKPIYDLTRKDRPFIWNKVLQEAFEDIKASLLNLQCYIYQTIKGGTNYFNH